jgi:hypothetical protein
MLNTGKLALQGHLRVYTVNAETGEETLHFSQRNQITYLHLSTLGELIVQRSTLTPSELAFDAMEIEASAAPYVSPPAPGDTGRPAGATRAKLYTFDRDLDVQLDVGGTPGLIQFRATVDAAEANGLTLRGAGIYTTGTGTFASRRLVARQQYTAISKTSALGISYVWDIQYTIV